MKSNLCFAVVLFALFVSDEQFAFQIQDNISFLFQTISYTAPNPKAEANPEPYAVAEGTNLCPMPTK